MKRKKIYKWQLEQKINDIVKNMQINKYSSEEKEILFNFLQKVILNEQTKENKNKLLEVIKNVNCYKDCEIISFINTAIEKIIREYPEEKYVIIKEDIDSSNHSIVSNLVKYGYFSPKNIIKYSKNKGIEDKYIKDNEIIMIIDDYIGSGRTIIDILKEIENKYNNKNIKIIGCIWQNNAIKNINKYIKKIRNNKYEIYDKNIIIENSYIEKCKEDNIIRYIEDRCNKCKNTDFKFGYNNTGAMIAINGIAPNNNISMLWRNDLGDNRDWIPPFNRDINCLVMQKKKEKLIKESYSEILNYYKQFYYKDIYTFEEFKMLLLLFNSYYIKINQITKLLGLDTNEDAEEILEKFKINGIIRYEVDSILEFADKNVIRQFKKINQQLSRKALNEFKKKCNNNLSI